MTDDDTTVGFATVTGREKGYDPAVVDAFLSTAREAFDGDTGGVDAEAVRHTAFPLRRGGYRTDAVDEAMARIEDAFAAKEREHAIRAHGTQAWVQDARARGEEILARIARGDGERFERTGMLGYGYGYDQREVDAVCRRLAAFLQSGERLTADQLRGAAFRMTRNGYREEQVDALLDAAVGVVLAVS